MTLRLHLPYSVTLRSGAAGETSAPGEDGMFIDTTSDVAARVTGAIRAAAAATGAGFEYLLKTAMRESNFDPVVRSPTSSATGLFQFIDQTWLATLKESGPAHGYARYADAIAKTPSGRYVVADPALRRRIMGLRTDPAANAVMAGAFTARNAAELAEGLGRKPTDGELYIAHFLGASGAVRFIKAAATSPGARAADAFPEAARANRSIFYNRLGGAKSYAQVYQGLVAKHQTSQVGPLASAQRPAAHSVVPAADTGAAAAATQQTSESAAKEDAARAGPVFHTLFRSGERGPVSPIAHELWGSKAGVQLASAVAPVSQTAAPGPMRRLGAPLDLFQFLRPEIRTLSQRA